MIRVFIVEDNLRHLATLQAKVLDAGYSVVGTSNDAENALEQIKERSVDVILIDIHLEQDREGIVLAEKVRQSSEIPVIFVTAMTTDDIILHAISTSPVGFLTKPIDPVELKASIELAIQKNAPSQIRTKQEYLTVRIGQKLRKIYFKDISHFMVESKNYVTLVDKQQKKFVVKGSLRKLLDWVLPENFLRTHHSHGINLAYVDYIDEPTQSICLSTGESIPIGRIFKKEVYQRMNIT